MDFPQQWRRNVRGREGGKGGASVVRFVSGSGSGALRRHYNCGARRITEGGLRLSVCLFVCLSVRLCACDGVL